LKIIHKKKFKIQLITVDRPGFGDSTPNSNNSLFNFAKDVSELATILGFEKYKVIGHSSGSVFALASAYYFPNHISKISVLGTAYFQGDFSTSDMNFSNRMITYFVINYPYLSKIYFKLLTPIMIYLFGLENIVESYFVTQEKEVFKTDALWREIINNSTLHSYKQGFEYAGEELILISKDYDFRVEDIEIEVDIWVGQLDLLTPPILSFELQKRLKYSTITVTENDGHFSLYMNHLDQILESLIKKK